MNIIEKARFAWERHRAALISIRALQKTMVGIGEATHHVAGPLKWVTYSGGWIDVNAEARRNACNRANRLHRIAHRLQTPPPPCTDAEWEKARDDELDDRFNAKVNP